MREIETAWLEWWESLGHVARTNRDKARSREAFEAGFLVAAAFKRRDNVSMQSPSPSRDRSATGARGQENQQDDQAVGFPPKSTRIICSEDGNKT